MNASLPHIIEKLEDIEDQMILVCDDDTIAIVRRDTAETYRIELSSPLHRDDETFYRFFMKHGITSREEYYTSSWENEVIVYSVCDIEQVEKILSAAFCSRETLLAAMLSPDIDSRTIISAHVD